MTPETKQDVLVGAVVALVIIVVFGPLLTHITPFDAVITGVNDQNLLEIAGKPVKAAADGIQQVAISDTAKDPCFANDLQTFSITMSTSMMTALIPPTSQVLMVCGIHVHANTGNPEVINIIEGGGSSCATSPLAVDGSLTSSKGIRIPGNGYFVMGYGGTTIYKTSGPNRGFCVQTAGMNGMVVSGIYHTQ